jgi:hypothetical protein
VELVCILKDKKEWSARENSNLRNDLHLLWRMRAKEVDEQT